MVNSRESSSDDDNLLSSFGAGDTIFREGEDGRVMFIIESGEIEIIRGRGDREVRLALLGPGDFFGEMGVLDNDLPRSTTARSVGPSRVLPIDAPTFERLLQEHPELAVRLLRRLSAQLRDILLEDLRAKRAVAGVLAGVQRRAEVTRPIVVPGMVTEKGTAPAETRPVPPRLVHPETGRGFPLSGCPQTLIGRPDPKTGIAPEIDLEPLDVHKSLSRLHAIIEQRGEFFYIREAPKALNGVWVAGHRLGTGKEYEMRNGDRLRIGMVELVFETRPAGED